ncbi:OLC1v1022320C1 [Oldenlandia corymbosa var. corymbosa]|uniref:OLC1v1022320C1 n=1 Tax=Oldenlandia corymbosa var. corymbosa TaxID=529605 RepID=A0AAV1BXL4_OLDCO|nr:OLC1v1022320C1 [Oldenlandia corymbosa var. corymbosa]
MAATSLWMFAGMAATSLVMFANMTTFLSVMFAEKHHLEIPHISDKEMYNSSKWYGIIEWSSFFVQRVTSLLNPTVMTCFPFLFRRRRLNSKTQFSSDIDDELSGIHNLNIFTYKELRAATNDFSQSNKIGVGGFGAVYKGKLKSGHMAAIKVLSAESKQGAQEFLTEIRLISEINHENLVKLYGCCVEGDHRILVYNYLENNSLAKMLLDEWADKSQFDWRTRVKICIGVARGLAYLHEEVRPHIVHRDIKASNILLDKDLTPKISDFGLAKLFPEDKTHISTRVAGTIGYLAPEYAVRGQLTRKADIYGFGVLLIEIVSGRCNTDSRLPIDEQYLLEKTWQLFKERELVGLVDTSLNGDFDAEQACRVLKIALICTQDSPKLRPAMSNVVKMLTGEIDIDDDTITKPGLITDFMELKIRSNNPAKPDNNRSSSGNNLCNSQVSSGSDNSSTTTSSTTRSSVASGVSTLG